MQAHLGWISIVVVPSMVRPTSIFEAAFRDEMSLVVSNEHRTKTVTHAPHIYYCQECLTKKLAEQLYAWHLLTLSRDNAKYSSSMRPDLSNCRGHKTGSGVCSAAEAAKAGAACGWHSRGH